MVRRRGTYWLWPAAFVSLLLILLILPLFLNPTPAGAQCGASSSSCKNCHEVNAEYPVNTSGEWHVSHAFGDFCAFCHAGNVQAREQDAAHEGMVYPLADAQGSCQVCHPSDYMEEAQIYADLLGVSLEGGDQGSTSGGSSGGGIDPASIALAPIEAPGERHATGALIDFNRHYEIEVLGVTDTSQLGNLILAVLAIGLLGFLFLLVWKFERLGDAWRRARSVPEDDWRRLAYSGAYNPPSPVAVPARPAAKPAPPSAPPSSPALGIDLGSIDAPTRAALERLLAHPEHGGAVIRALARLDPQLIETLTSLDARDRDLLMAVVKQLGETGS